MKLKMLPIGILRLGMLAPALACSLAGAQEGGTIKQPRAHTIYAIEVEPHLVFGFERYHGYGAGVGPGVRLSFPLSDDALVPEINNSVGIGVGFDMLFHDSLTSIQVPVVMQWNFFFHRRFSAFFEPGLGVAYTFSDGRGRLFPDFSIGGRVHISSKAAFTFRLGYPSASLGFSFLM